LVTTDDGPTCTNAVSVRESTRLAAVHTRSSSADLRIVDSRCALVDAAVVNRREALGQNLRTGGMAALAASCRSGRRSSAQRSSRTIRVDDSFARIAFELGTRDDADLGHKLLAHPALAAILRHEGMAGNRKATPNTTLDRILSSVRRAPPTSRVLDAWAGRDDELADFVGAAASYLASDVAFGGTVYLIVGYDIGIAASPDIALNVAHGHFQADPRELGFYATHEAHHIGFFALRGTPEVKQLNEPEQLLTLVRFYTQLEGMGVHAAYPVRAQHGALAGDADYSVYTDSAAAERVTSRYADVVDRISADRLGDDDVGQILGAMSSGERLWYQFGALVCSALERSRGRQAVIESITKPELFWAEATDLLAASRASH
jgi:hypothetical protein